MKETTGNALRFALLALFVLAVLAFGAMAIWAARGVADRAPTRYRTAPTYRF